MKNIIKIIYFFVTCGFLISCGSTHIITDRNDDFDIYVNGLYLGKKEVKITRTGPPHKILVEAKFNGQSVGHTSIQRRFTFGTFLVGYCTYGVGLIFDWRFPETIVIPTEYYSGDIPNYRSVWDKPQEMSVWDKPINN